MKHVGVKAAREDFHNLLTTLQRVKEPVSIEKNGIPIATIIDSQEYNQISEIISLLKSLYKNLPPTETSIKSSLDEVYGSVKTKKHTYSWQEAEKIAKEEHFVNRFKKK